MRDSAVDVGARHLILVAKHREPYGRPLVADLCEHAPERRRKLAAEDQRIDEPLEPAREVTMIVALRQGRRDLRELAHEIGIDRRQIAQHPVVTHSR